MSIPFGKQLSKDEESKYITMLLNGTPVDKQYAQDMLIKHNMRLVVHVVKRYSGTEDLEDLISIGSIGLIKAIQTFNETKSSLSTYACVCIRNEILMYLRKQNRYRSDISYFEPLRVNNNGKDIRLIDILEDEDQLVDENYMIKEDIKNTMLSVESILDDREKLVITKLFGLYGNDVMNQDQVAKELGLSRSYVSRIKNKSLAKLRNSILLQ